MGEDHGFSIRKWAVEHPLQCYEAPSFDPPELNDLIGLARLSASCTDVEQHTYGSVAD